MLLHKSCLKSVIACRSWGRTRCSARSTLRASEYFAPICLREGYHAAASASLLSAVYLIPANCCCMALATSLRYDRPQLKFARRHALCPLEAPAAVFIKAVVCCNTCSAYRYVVDLDKDIDVNKVGFPC